MKYKLRLVTKKDNKGNIIINTLSFDDAIDMEMDIRECHSQKESEDMIKEMLDKGFLLIGRRENRKWGAELFFCEKQ